MNFGVIVLLVIKRESSSTYTSNILLHANTIVYLTLTRAKFYYFLCKISKNVCVVKEGKGGWAYVLPEQTKVCHCDPSPYALDKHNFSNIKHEYIIRIVLLI